MTVYAFRRRQLFKELALCRGYGDVSGLHQRRMELAALRACRVLVS